MRLFKIFFMALLIILVDKPNISNAAPKSPTIIRDTEIEGILRSWANPVFRAANLNPDAVNIIIVQSNAVNAFVAGGSNIFFYTGLISKTENAGELIGVIAHETGHIAGGHLIKGREAMERASYESIIGTILGVGIAIISGDSAAAPAISSGGSTIAMRKYLAHSRIQESSADQAALTFLEKAKINPAGMASFMDKLKSDSYIPETQRSEYVRTHPLVDRRVEALKARINESEYNAVPYPDLWAEQHARMKAKLTGFINPNQVSWAYDDKDISIAARYARAIAAYQNNKINDALNKISALIKLEPQNPYFYELKGQMLVDFNKVSKAVPYYEKAIELLPKASLFRIALAHALIESATQNEANLLTYAIKQLEIALRSESKSTRVHRLLATAYGRLGLNNEAQIHLAEEAVLQRRFTYAKQQAEHILKAENEGSKLWLKAKDIIFFIETKKNK